METYNRDRHTRGIESYESQIETSTGRDFSIGLGLGLLVGVIGGLFLAPKSGDALRDDIKKIQDSIVKEEQNGEPTLSEQLDQKVSDVKQKVKDQKAIMAQKSRVKKMDETALKAQREAIREEVEDDNMKRANVVDMSKYAEKSSTEVKETEK